MSKAHFTPLERIENALRCYKADAEAYALDPDFGEPKLIVTPADVDTLIKKMNLAKSLLKICHDSLGFVDERDLTTSALMLQIKRFVDAL